MAHIDPRSVRIEFTSDPPRPGRPTDSPYGDGFAVPLMDRLFTASAEASIVGSPGEVTGPWTFGFIQMMWVQTWWAHYKGLQPEDGSVFINFARAERIAGSSTFPSVLRDTADHYTERLWINDTAAPGAIPGGHYIDVVPEGTPVPHAITPIVFGDRPVGILDYHVENDRTHRTNFIRETEMDYHFCTIFSARKPDGLYQHLAHFLWAVRWQGRFTNANFVQEFAGVVPEATGFTRSRVIAGPPGNVHVRSQIEQPQAENIVDISIRAFHEAKNPNSPCWHADRQRDHRFNVRG